jgi:DNA-binding NarL/FixJ family response regulator
MQRGATDSILTNGEHQFVQELLRAGANGYVLKQSASEQLLHAIRTVASGKNYFDPLVADEFTHRFARRRHRAGRPPAR